MVVVEVVVVLVVESKSISTASEVEVRGPRVHVLLRSRCGVPRLVLRVGTHVCALQHARQQQARSTERDPYRISLQIAELLSTPLNGQGATSENDGIA